MPNAGWGGLWLDIKYDLKWPRDLEQKSALMIETIGNRVVRGIKDNIKYQKDIWGRNLPPLKPSTIAKKKGRYKYIALYATGMLYNAIHFYKGHRPSIGNVGIKDVGVPSRRLLGIIHMYGDFKGGVARRFFGISPACRKDIRDTWERWITRMLSRAESYKKGRI